MMFWKNPSEEINDTRKESQVAKWLIFIAATLQHTRLERRFFLYFDACCMMLILLSCTDRCCSMWRNNRVDNATRGSHLIQTCNPSLSWQLWEHGKNGQDGSPEMFPLTVMTLKWCRWCNFFFFLSLVFFQLSSSPEERSILTGSTDEDLGTDRICAMHAGLHRARTGCLLAVTYQSVTWKTKKKKKEEDSMFDCCTVTFHKHSTTLVSPGQFWVWFNLTDCRFCCVFCSPLLTANDTRRARIALLMFSHLIAAWIKWKKPLEFWYLNSVKDR